MLLTNGDSLVIEKNSYHVPTVPVITFSPRSTNYRVANNTEYIVAGSTLFRVAGNIDYREAESTEYKAAGNTEYRIPSG